MRRKVLPAIIIVAILFTACASIDVGFKKAAAASKMTAEEAYDVVYTAYLRGLVTVEVKDKAAELRDRYTVIQSSLVKAIGASELDEATRLITLAGLVAKEIVDIVVEHKLEEKVNANDPR